MKRSKGVTKSLAAGLAVVALVFAAACASMDKAEMGGLGGAGVGALVGQAIGHSTGATLIGAGVGLGLGYIVGNEVDKNDAKKRQQATQAELQPLMGTTWQVVSINPPPKKPHASMVVSFNRDGTVTTTKTWPDGRVERDVEGYRIVGNTLIINKPDYIINSTYRIDGNQIYVNTGTHSIVAVRVGG